MANLPMKRWVGRWIVGVGILPPRFLGWGCLALTVSMLILMPVSGIWLLIPPVVGLLARKAR